MSKHGALYADINSIFGSTEWKAEQIKTFPQNFTGSNVGTEYIRLSIIAGDPNVANIPRSVNGQVIIDIFVPAGKGLLRATQIADKLDIYLAGKVIKTTAYGMTQLFSSTFTPRGNDKDNQSLYRAAYVIPFNFFGVK